MALNCDAKGKDMTVAQALNSVDDTCLERLKNAVPDLSVKPVEPRYVEEPRGRFKGQAAAVLLPNSTDQVAAVVRFAAGEKVGVVPYGGGTGLVGGQTHTDGPMPLLLSIERMASIRSLNAGEGTVVVDGGAVLADIQKAAGDASRLFPLSLASQGSCQIGGNLATNAGGLNVIRYGNARNVCLGIEAVLPNGDIFHGLSRVKKDNTGYDLKDLLIGSEGSLGIITGASLQLYARPENVGTAMLAVSDPDAALRILDLTRNVAGDTISAFELISGVGLEFLAQTMPQVRLPFGENPDWAVLIDLGMAGYANPQDCLEQVFENAVNSGWANDGLIAQNERQRQELWTVRESIPSANKSVGAIASTDISVPASLIMDFIAECRGAIAKHGDFRINCFGHLGDGNLHFNLFPPVGQAKSDYVQLADQLRFTVHETVVKFEGSISAEHGIGRLKTSDLARFGDPTKLAAMRAIKDALDPLGIMNPGAVLAR